MLDKDEIGKIIDLTNRRVDQYDRQNQVASNIIYINVGAACNENCVFCLVKGSESEIPQMTADEIKSAIKKFLEGGGKTIDLTGGEPTLRNDLPEIIAYAEQFSGLETVSIITNGVRLADGDFMKRIAEADSLHKINFCFSFHSHKPEISDKLTGLSGTFDAKVSAIKSVLSYGIGATLYHVITSDNYRDLPGFVEFINREFPRINYVTLAYPFPQGAATKNNWIYVRFSELEPYLTKALELLDEKKYTTYIPSCGQFPLCVVPGSEMKVLEPLSYYEENVVGLVGKDLFREFEWGSEKWIDKYKNKSEECKTCIFNNFCQGFWREYINQFGFDGIKPVNEDNFMGNRISHQLMNRDDLQSIKNSLIRDKINLLQFAEFDKDLVNEVVEYAKARRIFCVISDKKSDVNIENL